MVEIPGIRLLVTQWRKLTGNVLLRRLLTVLSLDILVKASAVLLLPVYLRLMKQEEYGVFNYILSIVYSFSTILNLGLYIAQSKIYHDNTDPAKRGRLIFNINVLIVIGSLVILIPTYLFKLDYPVIHFLFKNAVDYHRYRIWILLMTLITLFSFMFTNFLYTSEQINIIKRYSILRILSINLVSILALLYFRKEDAIAVRFIVISCLEILLLGIFYRFYLKFMQPVWDGKLIVRALKMGLPMMVSAVFNIIINFGDKFFLEKNVSYSELSVYYLAFSCVSVISLLSNSLQNVWLPLFFKEKDLERNIRRTNKMMSRLLLILIALSVAILLAVWVSLRLNIIPKNYSGVIYVLPFLLGGQIVICLALIYSNYLVYFEKTTIILVAGLVISIVSVLLNMLLIPVLKIYGAALTSLISNGLYLFIYYMFVRLYKKRHRAI